MFFLPGPLFDRCMTINAGSAVSASRVPLNMTENLPARGQIYADALSPRFTICRGAENFTGDAARPASQCHA